MRTKASSMKKFRIEPLTPVATERCDECNRITPSGHTICDNCAAYIAGAHYFSLGMLDES